MKREILVTLYLLHFKFWFNLFKLLPLKEKTTFVSSFGDNIQFVWNQVLQETKHETVVLQTNVGHQFEENERTKLYTFSLLYKPITYIKGIYHLATSRVVFIDNYFGFLSAANFKKSVTCVQLWHANGAIKQFGLKDPSIQFRSQRAHKRFLRVYDQFHRVVVGSDEMVGIFELAFGLDRERMLTTGIPRTDIFFNQEKMTEVSEYVKSIYEIPNDKKVIMYAPTFRDQQLRRHSIKLNIKKFYEELKDDYVLLLRLHPAILRQYHNNYPDFIIDVSSYSDMNHLLFISDYLITDYSSIPFEYALLNRPMIFYPYDLDEYSETRGFWEDYEELVPGPIAKNTNELIDLLKRNEFDLEVVKDFSQRWNRYNDGEASQKLVETIYQS